MSPKYLSLVKTDISQRKIRHIKTVCSLHCHSTTRPPVKHLSLWSLHGFFLCAHKFFLGSLVSFLSPKTHVWVNWRLNCPQVWEWMECVYVCTCAHWTGDIIQGVFPAFTPCILDTGTNRLLQHHWIESSQDNRWMTEEIWTKYHHLFHSSHTHGWQLCACFSSLKMASINISRQSEAAVSPHKRPPHSSRLLYHHHQSPATESKIQTPRKAQISKTEGGDQKTFWESLT